MEQINEEKLRYIDTGKVKIGIHHVPKPAVETYWDTDKLQAAVLPKPLGSLGSFNLPSLRQCLRWLLS